MEQEDISEKLSNLVESSISLSSEKDNAKLLEKILKIAKKIANADGGTLYIIGEDERLHFSITINDSLGIYLGGSSEKAINFPSLEIVDSKTGKFNRNNAATYVAITQETLNIANMYENKEFDFQGVKKFDTDNKYNSKSFLIIPLKDREGKTIAVIQLINSLDREGNAVKFTPLNQSVIEALAAQASLVIDYQKAQEEQKKFIESIIEIFAKAIDARSPFESSHCQRVPVITKMLATAAATASKSDYPEPLELSEDQWYALHVASWMNDCGKIVTPEHVMDKATKLEGIYNRIHEIRTRFEVIKRDLHIEYLQKRLEGKTDKETLAKNYNEKAARLNDDFVFLAKCNTGDAPLSDEDKKRIESIANRSWKRNFDITIGLSREEEKRYKGSSSGISCPAEEKLLNDYPYHINGRYNNGELRNMLIERGTLTPEERIVINEHAKITLEMLGKIPFPEQLKEVVEYASNHHEKLDGSGFPRGLKGDEISAPARIIAIADIFESLTAVDRPHRAIKTLSQALDIMNKMCDDKYLDRDLFNLFVKSGIPVDYAKEYLDEKQIDEVELDKYIKNK